MDARKCKDRERKRLKRAEMKERKCCKDKLERERERAKEYYEKNKQKRKEYFREHYANLSPERKTKKLAVDKIVEPPCYKDKLEKNKKIRIGT